MSLTLVRIGVPLIVGAALLRCGGRSALGEEESPGAGAFDPDEIQLPSEPDPSVGARSGRTPGRPRDRGGNNGGGGGARPDPNPAVEPPTPPMSECEVGATRCSDAAFELCDISGLWTLIQICESAARCDAETGCKTLLCGGEQFDCEGAELLTCRSDLGGWVVTETCATGCLCQLGGPSGRCATPSCARGEFRCNGASLEACNECRTGFGSYLLCSSPERCDAASGSCLEP